jgi:hypothetical protein
MRLSNDGPDHLVTITGDAATQAGNVLEIDADGDATAEVSVAANGALTISPGDVTSWEITATSMGTKSGAAVNGPKFLLEAPLATNPSIIANRNDSDTGLGWGGQDVFTATAGAAEALSLHEGQLGTSAGDVVAELFDVVTAPTSNPAAGDLFLYVDSDSVWIRNSAGTTTDLGAAGGSPAFNTITTGTNTTATMTVGSGAVILPASGGIIEATETVTEVYNNTGATIEKCAAVYISGFNVGASLPEVTVADADTVDDGNPAIGLVQAAITTATAGYVAVSGEITGVDTSVAEAWSEGDILYVNTNGAPAATSDCQETLTNVKPTGSGVGIQNIAVVGRTHGSLGTIEIGGSGRANDLPNIADDSAWVGSTTGVPTAEALPDTDTAGLALGYDTATNAFTSQNHASDAFTFVNKSYDAGGSGNLHAHEDGTAPTVDVDGEISVDETDNQIVYQSAGSDFVLAPERCESNIIEELADADDGLSLGMWADAVTITKVAAHCDGTCSGTLATIALTDRAGNAMTHTAPTVSTTTGSSTYQNVTAANTLTAGEGLEFNQTATQTEETNTYTIAFCYTTDRQ